MPADQEDILNRSKALEEKIKALGGRPLTEKEQSDLLKEMLEIRISELVGKELTRIDAVVKACNELAMDFKGIKEDSNKQVELLQNTKAELLAKNSPEEIEAAEDKAEEERKKKIKEQEEQEENLKEKSEASDTHSWRKGGYRIIGSQGAQGTAPTPEVANAFSSLARTKPGTEEYKDALRDVINSAPEGSTVYIHVNTHSVSSGVHDGPPKEFGKEGNATTLDYGGLRLTGYDYGLHGEARIAISKDATPEAKERFVEAASQAAKEISEQAKRGYSLMSDNCQKARTTLANAVDSTIEKCSMPWNANSQFEDKYKEQKENRPAPADGSATDSLGKTVAPELAAPLEKNQAPTPRPPSPT